LFEPGVVMVSDQFAEAPVELQFIEGIGSFTDSNGNPCGILAAAIADRQQQLQQLFLQTRGHSTHHSKVQKRDTAIIG